MIEHDRTYAHSDPELTAHTAMGLRLLMAGST